MEDTNKLTILLKAAVKSITPDKIVVKHGDQESEILNDGVIVCAGGTLPTPFLKEIGVMVNTKFGSA